LISKIFLFALLEQPTIRNFLTRKAIPDHPSFSGLSAVLYILLITSSILSTYSHAEEAAPIAVRYPASESNPYYYKRVKYFVEILELALSKSNHQYQLQKVSLPFMNESRSKTNLTANLYDVHWLNAQAFLDEDLQPVRIPLCKGLTGWRVFFIRPESQQKFSSVKSATDLKNFTGGNGNDWPEAVLYEQAGLPQKLSGSWKGLFNMLKQHRIDYLSRSALEIYDEENAFPDLNLKIESQLIIQYPAAYYFYVNKNNQQLATDIQIGLERAIADGSFDKIFNRYFSEKIKRLDLGNRRAIKIATPENTTLLSDKKAHPSYWYTKFSPTSKTTN
jgi:Bacterial extracellular solute-binding proteins, family 3